MALFYDVMNWFLFCPDLGAPSLAFSFFYLFSSKLPKHFLSFVDGPGRNSICSRWHFCIVYSIF